MKKKKTGKIILKIFIGLILIGIVYAGLMFALILSAAKKETPKNADTLIVLGAQVWGKNLENARPSHVFKERLNAAVTYLNENKNTKVIIAGGKGSDEIISEAEAGKRYLIEKGILPERILEEDRSTDTMENLRNAKSMAKGKVVIDSNDFHIYRALMFAKRLGYKDVSGLPAKSKTHLTTKLYIREILALGYYIIFPSK
ncbi:MAG: YdcF family protein [Lachnospiraceae bacterium]|jgi:uncharacterized SAM-binding protein YcdF (DUF218 family)|nr:YdcF family protein [Lachnospiraceae bacterium]